MGLVAAAEKATGEPDEEGHQQGCAKRLGEALTEPSHAGQKTTRDWLLASPDGTDIVAQDAIFHRQSRSEAARRVVIGESQSLYPDNFETYYATPYADLHIWTVEPGTTTTKAIAGAVATALRRVPWQVLDHHCAALTVTGCRFLRDPGSEHSHGIVAVQAVILERPS